MKNREQPIIGHRDYLRKQGLAKTTIATHFKILNLFFKWTEAENIEAEDVTYNELLVYIQQQQQRGVKQVSIQRVMNILKHYYNHLQEKGYRYDNPTDKIELHGIERKKMYTLLNIQELEDLYTNYPLYENINSPLQQNRSKRNKIITGMLIWQGLSATDLRILTTKHIHLRDGIIEVPGTRRTNPRSLKLEPGQLFDLMDYIQNVLPELSEIKSDTDQYVFNIHGTSSFHNSLNRLVFRLKALNPNIENLGQIRANVIIHWLKTHNLRQVQYMAGHRYVSSTEKYQLNDIEDLRQEVSKFHPLG